MIAPTSLGVGCVEANLLERSEKYGTLSYLVILIDRLRDLAHSSSPNDRPRILVTEGMSSA